MNKNRIKWSSYIACILACQYLLTSCDNKTNNLAMKSFNNSSQDSNLKQNSKKYNDEINGDTVNSDELRSEKIEETPQKEPEKNIEETQSEDSKQNEINENENYNENCASNIITNGNQLISEESSEDCTKDKYKDKYKLKKENFITKICTEFNNEYPYADLSKAENYREICVAIERNLRENNALNLYEKIDKSSGIKFQSEIYKEELQKGNNLQNNSNYVNVFSLISKIKNLNKESSYLLTYANYLSLTNFAKKKKTEEGEYFFKGKISNSLLYFTIRRNLKILSKEDKINDTVQLTIVEKKKNKIKYKMRSYVYYYGYKAFGLWIVSHLYKKH